MPLQQNIDFVCDGLSCVPTSPPAAEAFAALARASADLVAIFGGAPAGTVLANVRRALELVAERTGFQLPPQLRPLGAAVSANDSYFAREAASVAPELTVWFAVIRASVAPYVPASGPWGGLGDGVKPRGFSAREKWLIFLGVSGLLVGLWVAAGPVRRL